MLVLLAVRTGTRGGTSGFGIGVTPWEYAKTQFQAQAHYLWLSVWPSPLIFDYGARWAKDASDYLPYAVLIGLLAAATAVSVWRCRAAGLLGAWFFAILAPTSSILPGNRQTLAEHRMYLPLAAVVTLVVCGGWAVAEKRLGKGKGRVWIGVLLAGALGLGALTVRRNQDYASVEGIWRDTVIKRPDNPFAHYNWGVALFLEGRIPEAISQYREAVRLKPDYIEGHNKMGFTLLQDGRTDEAMAEDREALRLKPDFAEAHLNLGNALNSAGRIPEAIAEQEEAIRLKPDLSEAHNSLGCDLAGIPGRLAEAIAQFEEAIRLKPDYAEAYKNLGNALCDAGRRAEAVAQYREAIRLKPDFFDALSRLGDALRTLSRNREAIDAYRDALRLKPDSVEVHNNLALALDAEGQVQGAISEYREALRLNPDNPTIHLNLAGEFLKAPGENAEAAQELEAVLRLQPDNELARQVLGRLRSAQP